MNPAGATGEGVGGILVLGGSGYLGSRLAKAFAEAGRSVTVALRRMPDRRQGEELGGVGIVEVGQAGTGLTADVLRGVEVVVNAAGAYGRSGEGLRSLVDANIVFPLSVLEVAAEAGVSAFVNCGTALAPELNAYALSKRQFSDWGRLITEDGGPRFVDARIEHFYGPGDDDMKFATHLARALLEDQVEYPLTPGEQERDFIFIDDVVAAFVVLVEHAHEFTGYQTVGVGSGRRVTIREFAELVHRVAGSSTRLDFGALPYRPNEVMRSCADLTVLETFGWQASVPLEVGVKRLLHAEGADGEVVVDA
jgi:CDP-paratose synthetase